MKTGRVDEFVPKALAADGNTDSGPKDYGFMYAHGFQDLDGYIWEVFHMESLRLSGPHSHGLAAPGMKDTGLCPMVAGP